MADVFISYAHEDRSSAEALAHALTDAGWSVWWDSNVKAGRCYDDAIEEALTTARAVVVLWSRFSVKSEWVRTEAEEAASRDIFVPVTLDDTRPPLGFRRRQSLDLSRWHSGDRSGFDELKESIGSLVAPAPMDAQGFPLPPLLQALARSRFFGRDREISVLRDALRRAVGARPILALVAGEPGQGKTRLAAEFAQRAAADGAIVLLGRATEETLTPYQPFVEAFQHLAEHFDPNGVWDEIGGGAPDLVRIVPEIANRLTRPVPEPFGDPQGARYRLFEAAAAFLGAVASRKPVVFVFDDLQWADESSFLLLKHILRSDRAGSLLVVATYRDTEVGRTDRVDLAMSDLYRDHTVASVRLPGLDTPSVAGMLTQILGAAPAQDLVADVRNQTAGNPFYIEEVARSLREIGGRSTSHGATVLPPEVRAVIAQRVERLGANCQAMLQTAAVMGRDFDGTVLQHATGLPEPALLDALDESVEAGLVTEISGNAARFQFVHALVRDTLYHRLTSLRRIRIHARIGDVLEELNGAESDAHLAERAHHFFEASRAGDDRRALSYARRAAEAAERQLAHGEAAGYYRRALSLASIIHNPIDECDLLIALGHAEERAGRFKLAQAAFDEAIEKSRLLREPFNFARASLGRAGWYTEMGTASPITMALLREALDLLPASDSVERASVLARLAQELRYSADWQQAEGLSHEAELMARRLGDDTALASILHSAQLVRWVQHTPAHRRGVATELSGLADRLRNHELSMWGRMGLMAAHLELGDIGEVDRILPEYRDMAALLSHPTYRWQGGFVTANRAFIAGDLHRAAELSAATAKIGFDFEVVGDVEIVFASQSFHLYREMDRLEELMERLQRWIYRHRHVKGLLCELAFAYVATGRRDEARTIMRDLSQDNFRGLRRDFVWMYVMCLAAEVVVALRDEPLARTIRDLLAPFSAQGVVGGLSAVYHGSVSRYLGLLSHAIVEHDRAEQDFLQAVEFDTRLDAPIYVGHAKADLARLYLDRGGEGDVERARTIVEQLRNAPTTSSLPALSSRVCTLASQIV